MLSNVMKVKRVVYSTHPVIASLDHPLLRKEGSNALFMRSKERADQRSVVG